MREFFRHTGWLCVWAGWLFGCAGKSLPDSPVMDDTAAPYRDTADSGDQESEGEIHYDVLTESEEIWLIRVDEPDRLLISEKHSLITSGTWFTAPAGDWYMVVFLFYPPEGGCNQTATEHLEPGSEIRLQISELPYTYTGRTCNVEADTGS